MFSFDEKFTIIAGPCAVESEEQIMKTATAVKNAGGHYLRGGAFKARTAPQSFQGLELAGIELLKKARKETGLKIVSEITSIRYVDNFERDIDIIQVGKTAMQNFDLLKELGNTNKPILLKRGVGNTIEEWLSAAEYIKQNGNENIILCERGIRTFETAYRYTLDFNAVLIAKEKTNYPVIVDPSHAAGNSKYVAGLCKAAKAIGADGIMVEVHPEPEKALCDGAQSLNLDEYNELITTL